jgi:hypothetical protein
MALDPKKFVWWKIILGLVLICIRFYMHYSPPLDPSKAENTGQQIGMGVAEGVLWVIGCALVYVGVKPNWNEWTSKLPVANLSARWHHFQE